MKSLVQLILRCSDLVEAEGRLAKQQILRVATAILILCAAAVFAVAAVALLMGAIYIGLAQVVEPAAAMVAVCALLAVISGSASLVAYHVAGNHHSGNHRS